MVRRDGEPDGVVGRPRPFDSLIVATRWYIASEEDPFPPPVETHRQEFGRMGPNGEFHVSKAPSNRDFRQRFPGEVSAQISFFRWVL